MDEIDTFTDQNERARRTAKAAAFLGNLGFIAAGAVLVYALFRRARR